MKITAILSQLLVKTCRTTRIVLSRSRQLYQRIPQFSSLNWRETTAGRLCDAVGGIMVAPRWSVDAVPPDQKRLFTPSECGAH